MYIENQIKVLVKNERFLESLKIYLSRFSLLLLWAFQNNFRVISNTLLPYSLNLVDEDL